ncbi:hypothetical protein LMH87_000928 [Akanthomyces muscarius]|uniref:Uncharacterized protein n=1 Tax=Akanthomyces muscarius TaxID=2231603 RepID=A0A9W8QGD1_AKAMU|nr:hypothetical protein LMH87_000928 [Akanthomyces muscarius]KAJ4155694.1 hypothetical protein LMH87_000928 [Akanthomyces muscarius]
MQTNALLVSLLTSGFAAAAAKSYSTPLDCTPSVAFTSPAYGPPDYTASTSTRSPSLGGHWPHEYTTTSVHETVKIAEGPSYTTSSHPHQPTVMTIKTTSTTGSTNAYKIASSTFKTFNTGTTGIPMSTYGPVQSLANHIDGQGLLIATVVAGLCFFI